jgi:dGTPase
MPELAGRVAEAFEQDVRRYEEERLSPLAVRSYETRGRLHEEDECRLRTPFQRDRDRILHSKVFRRLKGKTQVFIDPAGDHYRTRMTHTLETTGIARGVARALRLNEDLVEAIGLGHDMGHPPFGHAGEDALDAALEERFGRRFRHNEQSLRLAESLNLTEEVRDGILTHTGEREPATLEGKIVRIVDQAVGDIVQSEEVGGAMLRLRTFMFDHVYLGPHALAEHDRAYATVRRIFESLVERGEDADAIVDFVSGMTDRFALEYAASIE